MWLPGKSGGAGAPQQENDGMGWWFAAATAASALASKYSSKKQEALTREQMVWNAREAQKNRDFQERMSNTSYRRAAADLKAAGLNRILALGNPASTPGGAQAHATNLGDAAKPLAGLADAIPKGLQAASARQNIKQSKSQVDLNKTVEQVNAQNSAKLAAEVGLTNERKLTERLKQRQINEQIQASKQNRTIKGPAEAVTSYLNDTDKELASKFGVEEGLALGAAALLTLTPAGRLTRAAAGKAISKMSPHLQRVWGKIAKEIRKRGNTDIPERGIAIKGEKYPTRLAERKNQYGEKVLRVEHYVSGKWRLID